MEALALEANKCTDGICCFSLVIGEKARDSSSPVKLVIEQYLRPSPHQKAPTLTHYQLSDSCGHLGVHASRSEDGGTIVLSLRCNSYGKRPKACKEYPTSKRHQGPCLYNEYLAPDDYKNEIYKYTWSVYYGIPNKPDILRQVLGDEIAELIPGMLKAKELKAKKIGKIFRRKEYVLFPVPKCPEILLLSKEHQLITSAKQAFQQWPKELNHRMLAQKDRTRK